MELLPVNRIGGGTLPDVKMIADAWGTPLVFSRWPTADPELNPNGPQPAPPWRDPEDPQGILSDPLWVRDPPPNQTDRYWDFVQRVHETGKQKSYKLTPTLMSAGPDKEYGLDITYGMADPADGSKFFSSLKVADPTATHDNIYTYRLRMGGSGN
jgi:hypothetical protein